MGVSINDRLLFSVGELNRNKNHEVVIRAIAKLNDELVHYAIAGVGELHDHLLDLARSLGVAEQVHLLGYRSDVKVLYKAADIYIHPSIREGLSVALMEALASKTLTICSNIRGNNDIVPESAMFSPSDVQETAEIIREYLSHNKSEEIADNYEKLQTYDLKRVMPVMMGILQSL